MTTIPLASPSLARSSDRPGSFRRAVLTTPGMNPGGCSPIWSCSVRGFACHRPYGRRGALLPHLFTLTPDGTAEAVPYVARTSDAVPHVARTSDAVPYVARTTDVVPYVARTSDVGHGFSRAVESGTSDV